MNELMLLSGSSSLHNYLDHIAKIPLLTVDQERQLALKMRDSNCVQSAQTLVLHTLRFVAFIARKYDYCGLPLHDLIQEGNIALMLAVNKFDPDNQSGARLHTFSVMHITRAIKDYIADNIKIFRLATSKATRKILNHINHAQAELGWLTNQSASQLADKLNVTVDQVRDAEQRIRSKSTTINITDDDNEGIDLQDDRYTPENILMEYQIHTTTKYNVLQALSTLDDRSKDVVTQRWLLDSPSSLLTLSKQYGVSQERIRQIEVAAFKKLRLMC